ncbi:hypothetical protein E4U42_005193 [Claviceps africana]|uniref:MICOS complex subunit MIC12 n=1 Tax=Claviceps africana TaxID=83212 RepID=A0A8K0J693_9HYPO|nr:hypothetical protein E4U42_005193 [Claviceps africana]
MGFVTGFTGGVTLTLSVAYLSILAHQRNREEQGQALRAQALAIQSLIDPIPQPLPPTRSQVAAAKRAEAVEVAKERWNDEIERAVRWVQRTDWEDVREGLEDRIASLWDVAFGESIEDSAAKAKNELQTAVSKAQAGAQSAAGIIKDQAKSVFEKARAEEEDFAAKVRDNALQAQLAAWRAAQQVERKVSQTTAEAQKTAQSVLEKEKDKAAEAAGKVKSAVGLTGAGTALGHVDLAALNPVQKALDQRFQRPTGDKRSAAEVLKERYMALDRRDNTLLRGL